MPWHNSRQTDKVPRATWLAKSYNDLSLYPADSWRGLEDLVANSYIVVATDPKDMYGVVYALLSLAGNFSDPSSHSVCSRGYSSETSVLELY
jgi:hypothetical protein